MSTPSGSTLRESGRGGEWTPHVKPRARGWIHLVSAEVVLVAGTALVAVSWSRVGLAAGLATLVYALSVLGMFTVSAFYHRIHWQSLVKRLRMMRVDHSMIFVLIAGTYTPFAVLSMPWQTGRTLLALVWGGALAGIVVKVFRPQAPRWIGVSLYLLLGWVSLFYIPAIVHGSGPVVVVLLAVGGFLYSIGGVFYALRRPDPWPVTFGYHEFFHLCTVLAALCHYIAVWLAVF